jgi:hypothetical protein
MQLRDLLQTFRGPVLAKVGFQALRVFDLAQHLPDLRQHALRRMRRVLARQRDAANVAHQRDHPAAQHGPRDEQAEQQHHAARHARNATR